MKKLFLFLFLSVVSSLFAFPPNTDYSFDGVGTWTIDFVQQSIATETTNRVSSDTALTTLINEKIATQTVIDYLASETINRIVSDLLLQPIASMTSYALVASLSEFEIGTGTIVAYIATETLNRIASDGDLTNLINGKIATQTVIDYIATETLNRITSDDLKQNISSMSVYALVSSMDAAIATETSNRISSDSDLLTLINGKIATQTVMDYIATETVNRIASDTFFQPIASMSVYSLVDSMSAAIATETTNRTTADSFKQNIASMSVYSLIASMDAAIATETTNRIASDNLWLAKTGGSITGLLAIATGTLTQPGLCFASSTNSGIDLNAIGQPNLVASSVEVQRWTATQTNIFNKLVIASETSLASASVATLTLGAGSLTLPSFHGPTAADGISFFPNYVRFSIAGVNAMDVISSGIALRKHTEVSGNLSITNAYGIGIGTGTIQPAGCLDVASHTNIRGYLKLSGIATPPAAIGIIFRNNVDNNLYYCQDGVNWIKMN